VKDINFKMAENIHDGIEAICEKVFGKKDNYHMNSTIFSLINFFLLNSDFLTEEGRAELEVFLEDIPTLGKVKH
jgi:hypothetical protein